MVLYLFPRETSAASPFPRVGDKEVVYQTVWSQAIRTPRWDHQSFNCSIQLGRKMLLSLSLFLPPAVVAEVLPVTCWQFRRGMADLEQEVKKAYRKMIALTLMMQLFYTLYSSYTFINSLFRGGGGLEIWQERSNPNSKNHWNTLLWRRKKTPAFLLGSQRNEVPTVETPSNETLERSLG